MSYNGNFVCVFECTIVNLAKLRIRNLQILLEIGLLKKKTEQNKTNKKKKRKKKEKKGKEKKSKLHQVWAIPIPISTTKDVKFCSNG